jgi:hypothetical protein
MQGVRSMVDIQILSRNWDNARYTYGAGLFGYSVSVSGGTKGLQLSGQFVAFGLSAKMDYSFSDINKIGNLNFAAGLGTISGTPGINERGFIGLGYSSQNGFIATASASVDYMKSFDKFFSFYFFTESIVGCRRSDG